MSFLEDNYGFRADSHDQNIINLTSQILNSHNCTGWLYLTQGVCISIIPSICGYFLIESHSPNNSGKTDPKGILMID